MLRYKITVFNNKKLHIQNQFPNSINFIPFITRAFLIYQAPFFEENFFHSNKIKKKRKIIYYKCVSQEICRIRFIIERVPILLTDLLIIFKDRYCRIEKSLRTFFHPDVKVSSQPILFETDHFLTIHQYHCDICERSVH